MTSLIRASVAGILAVAMTACATTSTSATTWTADGNWARPGRVESVTEVVHRVNGDPGSGALLGAVIGGLLFGSHRGPSLLGAAAGAGVGAAASQGRSESRTYNVVVRFDDGATRTFAYANESPFQPGEPVFLTPHGLEPR